MAINHEKSQINKIKIVCVKKVNVLTSERLTKKKTRNSLILRVFNSESSTKQEE